VLSNPIWQFEDDGNAGYVLPAGLREPDAHRKPQGNFGGVDMATRAFRKAHPNPDLALYGVGPAMGFKHYYNSFGSFRVPMGPGWCHSYFSYVLDHGDHSFVVVRFGDGTEIYFTFDEGQQKYIPEPGSYATLTRIDDGVNEGYDLKTKDQVLYKFRLLSVHATSPIPGIYLIEVVDRNGNELSLNWQASHGLLLDVTDTSGRQFNFAYNDPNDPLMLTQVTETALNRSVHFAYDQKGRLVSFIDARGQTTIYEYDGFRMTNIIRPEGNNYQIGYNPDGRVNSLQNGTSQPAVIEAITGGVQVTTPEDNLLKFETSNYVLTRLIDGHLSPTVFDYNDPLHPTLPTKVTDRRGHETQYVYDERGNVTKLKNHLLNEADFSYDLKNDLESSSDFHLAGQTGNVTNYTYDANGNLTDIDNPLNENTHFTYDAKGLVNSLRDGRLKTTNYTYNAYGNLTHITNPEQNITEYSYDGAGRLLWRKDGENKYTYYDYDNNDGVTEIKNHNQFPVTINYDLNGNLDLVRWTHAGQTSDTTYQYDALDRLQNVTSPLNKVTLFNYNDDNTLSSKTDPKQQSITYDYDSNALVQNVHYPNHTRVITRYPNGLINTISSPEGTTTFQYDVLDRLEQVEDPYGKIVQYVYNERNNLEKIIYPGGKEVLYAYDNLNRLISVTDWVGGATEYEYDPSGNLTRIGRPNNTEAIYTYDDASRLTSITEQKIGGGDICTYTYNLNPVGNIMSTAATEPLTGSVTARDVSYTYDKANRLLTAGTVTYTYDDNGNRRTSSDAGGTTYTWDYENLLTGLTQNSPSRTVQHYYDGMNNRIARVEGGVTKRYVLDLNADMSRILAETNANGTVTGYYVYGIGLISRIETDDTRHFYHFNNRGDTVALTDASGDITDSYAYDEYGQLLATTGTTDNPFKFVGRFGVMEEGSNLYSMRARIYDGEEGRFLSEDPLGFKGGDWNIYAYVLANPIVDIDPSGLAGTESWWYKNTGWADDQKTVITGIWIGCGSLAIAGGVALTVATAPSIAWGIAKWLGGGAVVSWAFDEFHEEKEGSRGEKAPFIYDRQPKYGPFFNNAFPTGGNPNDLSSSMPPKPENRLIRSSGGDLDPYDPVDIQLYRQYR